MLRLFTFYSCWLSHGATAVRRWCLSGRLPRSAGCWDRGVWKERRSCAVEEATASGRCVPLSRCPEDSGDTTGSSPETVTRRPAVPALSVRAGLGAETPRPGGRTPAGGGRRLPYFTCLAGRGGFRRFWMGLFHVPLFPKTSVVNLKRPSEFSR